MYFPKLPFPLFHNKQMPISGFYQTLNIVTHKRKTGPTFGGFQTRNHNVQAMQDLKSLEPPSRDWKLNLNDNS